MLILTIKDDMEITLSGIYDEDGNESPVTLTINVAARGRYRNTQIGFICGKHVQICRSNAKKKGPKEVSGNC